MAEPKDNLDDFRPLTPTIRRRRQQAFNVGVFLAVAGLCIALIPLGPDIVRQIWGHPVDSVISQFRFFAGVIGLSSAMLAVAGAALGYLRDGVLNPFSAIGANVGGSRAEWGTRAADRETEVHDAVVENETAAEQLARELSVRLDQELRNQDRKANLNLILGGVGAVVALAILATSVFMPPRATVPAVFWAVAGARALLSLTASVFAFFFLSTYRRNLTESRYFHNELTNVESKLLAIQLFGEKTLVKPDRGDEVLLEMLSGLAATERNFILRKGETTTDLHQKEIDRQEHDALLAALSALAAQAAPPRPTATAPATPRRKT